MSKERGFGVLVSLDAASTACTRKESRDGMRALLLFLFTSPISSKNVKPDSRCRLRRRMHEGTSSSNLKI
jgi:hypothetical protein